VRHLELARPHIPRQDAALADPLQRADRAEVLRQLLLQAGVAAKSNGSSRSSMPWRQS
jgi:hypothetical protein